MKKLIKVFLLIFVLFFTIACGEEKVLTTPTNIVLDKNGVLTWDAVPNATSYKVLINDEEIEVTTPFYVVPNMKIDMVYSITAYAEGYEKSPTSAPQIYTAPSIVVPDPTNKDIVVAISGSSEIRSGKSITLKATVTGAEDTTVTWSIKSGSEYATIDQEGILTATKVSNEEGNKVIEVIAASNEDNNYYGSKIITIVTKPELTQEMLDVIANEDYLSFEGYINVNLYPYESNKLYSTTSTSVRTALDGEYWYAEYENGDTLTKMGLYFKNHNNIACQVGVNFMNVEEYEPALDNKGNPITWEEYGLYNNFKGLKVSDFEFDTEIWRWKYVGSDESLDDRLIASANPYEFKTNGFSLIIEEGEIMGIYAISKDDYTIVEQYRAVQELIVAINYGEENVKVTKIPKFVFDQEKHTLLKEAIENMQNLESYSMTFNQVTGSSISSGYTQEGFTEIITSDDCYFVPHTISYDKYGKEVYTPIKNSAYGYHKFSENLYNAYFEEEDKDKNSLGFKASRAYNDDFSKAKPTFAFAPEIYTERYVDDKEGTTTYYVNDIMSAVASTYYYGVGNDIQLYGLFATVGYISATEDFTPYVVVDNETKMIVESGFYFYLGYLYGIIEIEYYGFNESFIPEDVSISFEKREVPTSWSQLEIYKSSVSGNTEDDEAFNAVDMFKELFGIEEGQEAEDAFLSELPFFGTPLGDTFGFGLTSYHRDSNKVNHECISLYYDVPLDVDYSIDSSLKAVEDYLISLGFVKNDANEFSKGNICVAPVDSSLDLFIYVWKI